MQRYRRSRAFHWHFAALYLAAALAALALIVAPSLAAAYDHWEQR